MAKPLEGIRVLDLTRVLAGPFCTMLLQDLGAEVLKVEMPERGDDSRHFGPFKEGRSLYFMSINRGKRSMTLNLKSDEGRDVFRSLVKESDVLVENFRPGVMEKLGLGWEDLHELNPRLVYAASSGYGHTGPDSQKPAYDILAQAEGGIMSVTGWPGQAPVRVGASLGDITAALFTANGIMAALYQRESTGLGQKVDVAMLDCQVAILENALARYQVAGAAPEPLGNRHPTITPFQAYKTRDDYIVVAMGNDALWASFCAAVDRRELTTDERFATNHARSENIEALNAEVMEPLFASRGSAAWMETLQEARIPHARINTIDKVMSHPQVLARKMVVSVDDPVAGRVRIAGNPIKMTNLPDEESRPRIPELGEHTDSVLAALGMNAEEIASLRKRGAV